MTPTELSAALKREWAEYKQSCNWCALKRPMWDKDPTQHMPLHGFDIHSSATCLAPLPYVEWLESRVEEEKINAESWKLAYQQRDDY